MCLCVCGGGGEEGDLRGFWGSHMVFREKQSITRDYRKSNVS